MNEGSEGDHAREDINFGPAMPTPISNASNVFCPQCRTALRAVSSALQAVLLGTECRATLYSELIASYCHGVCISDWREI